MKILKIFPLKRYHHEPMRFKHKPISVSDSQKFLQKIVFQLYDRKTYNVVEHQTNATLKLDIFGINLLDFNSWKNI